MSDPAWSTSQISTQQPLAKPPEVLLFSWLGRTQGRKPRKETAKKSHLHSGLDVWADVIGERFMETPKERGQIKLETYEKTRF